MQQIGKEELPAVYVEKRSPHLLSAKGESENLFRTLPHSPVYSERKHSSLIPMLAIVQSPEHPGKYHFLNPAVLPNHTMGYICHPRK